MGHGKGAKKLVKDTAQIKEVLHPKLPKEIGTDPNFTRKIVWINVVGFVLLHMAAFYGLWLCFSAKIWTNIYSKSNKKSKNIKV